MRAERVDALPHPQNPSPSPGDWYVCVCMCLCVFFCLIRKSWGALTEQKLVGGVSARLSSRAVCLSTPEACAPCSQRNRWPDIPAQETDAAKGVTLCRLELQFTSR